jgi:hypothetical protein
MEGPLIVKIGFESQSTLFYVIVDSYVNRNVIQKMGLHIYIFQYPRTDNFLITACSFVCKWRSVLWSKSKCKRVGAQRS